MPESIASIINNGNGNGSTETRVLLPVPTQDALVQKMLEEDAAGFVYQPIRVSIEHRMRVFAFPDESTERELHGIILVARVTRGRWEQGSKRPVCVSYDGLVGYQLDEEGGLKLETETRCVDEFRKPLCPYNKWGSGRKDSNDKSRRKACKEQRRLLFLPDGFAAPVLMQIPPSSIKRFDKFASIFYTRGIPICSRYVTLGLEKVEKGEYTYSLLTFQTGDPVPAEKLIEIERLREMFLPSIIRDVTEQTEEEAEAAENETTEVDLSNVPF